jgi:hypothetical protein
MNGSTQAQGLVQFAEPTLYQRGVGVAVGIVLILLTISLLRRFRMKEEHGLPWLLGGAALVLFSLFPPLLKVVTLAMGAGTPATALFAGCILFLLTLNLLFSIVLSRLKRQVQTLAIELAIRNATAPGQRGPTASPKPDAEPPGAS